MQKEIAQVCDSLKDLLTYKNEKYGNSALEPLKFFSKLESDSALKVRLDDKLSRIRNAEDLRKNDIADLIGYLTLLCISRGWTDFSEFKD
jgi:hypothetical protein